MLHQLKYYILHRLKSFHLHGIHSPFVFALNRDCLQDLSHFAEYDEIVRFRESVKNHPQQLQFEDHGAGSKRLHQNNRKSTDILKHNCSSLKRTKLLYRLANYLNAERVLELGTSLGIGTHALSLGSDQVTSIEGSKEVYNYAKERLQAADAQNVELIQGTFSDFFESKLTVAAIGTYDLIFMDGHHDGIATQYYFEQLLPYCHSNTVVIIDDIHWSKGMTKAWNQLTQHSRVTASINTYQWGLLFLREEQQQQAFYVKL